MCEPNRVRVALAKVSLKQVESARDTARARARETDNPQLAGMFNQVADECDAEVSARLLTVLTNSILKESQELTRQMTELVTQMTS